MKPPSQNSLRNIIALVLFLITWIAYRQSVGHGFIIFDDPGYVTANPHVLQGLQLKEIAWAFSNTEIGHWHPLNWLSHMTDVSLFGLNPAGHHLMNVMFHAVNSVLLFLVLLKMTGARWRSAFVAALFALHPLNVESVAWIANRKNVLCTFFWMLTMGAYWYYVKKPGTIRYMVVFLFLLLGLLTKPLVITLPFVLLLLDFWPLDRLRKQSKLLTLRKLVKEKIPLFALSVFSGVMTVYAAKSVTTIAGLDIIPVATRIANTFIFYLRYVGKTIWPQDLAIFYPYIVDWSIAGFFVAALVVGGITFFVLLKRHAYPYLVVGWFWFLVVLLPNIGIIQAGSQSIADRYAYIPLIGLFIILAWGVPDLLRAWPRREAVLIILSGVVLCVLFNITERQVAYWQNSTVLFRHAVQIIPGNFFAHNLLGKALMENEQFEESVQHFQLAIKAKPDFANAYHNLGLAYFRRKQYDEAMNAYAQVIRYQPIDASVYMKMAEIFMNKGKTDQALQAYEKARSLQPRRADINNNLGIALAKLGRNEEAGEAFEQAIRLQPEHAGAHNNLAMILLKQGNNEGAIAQFQEAIRLQPAFANAHYFLGEAMQRMGLLDKACFHKKEAIRINPLFRQRDDFAE